MFQFVLVVWYGLVNVPGLFDMCRDCLKSGISNSPGTKGIF